MIIAVTGSTGLVGSALVDALKTDGHSVRRVVRQSAGSGADEIRWDPTAGTIDAVGFKDVDAVAHLAGESVAAHRWTAAVKQEIRDSRVRGTNLLCQTLAGLASKPSVLVSASAIGYYGDRGDERLEESSPPGAGFLADVCQQWEAATNAARDADIRVVNLRIGVVLSRKGGALASMLTPFRLGAGGVIGSGQQYMSWITLDDLVRVIQFALHASAICGPVNAVAPEAVTNREFTKSLGRVLSRPTIFPFPAFAARLKFGEMADELLLASAHVNPGALSAARFEFAYPQLEPALRHLLV
ncbi:MAG: TIGR01777 family oxidoreductase [Planctomycetes bacterium]|nr:TIGR01777 family oxidoreductase [Planctomycetota bacterium]